MFLAFFFHLVPVTHVFCGRSSEDSSAPSSISGGGDDAKFKGRRRVVDDSDSS